MWRLGNVFKRRRPPRRVPRLRGMIEYRSGALQVEVCQLIEEQVIERGEGDHGPRRYVARLYEAGVWESEEEACSSPWAALMFALAALSNHLPPPMQAAAGGEPAPEGETTHGNAPGP